MTPQRQLTPPPAALRLLIVADIPADVDLVTATLKAAGVAFTYDIATTALACGQLLQENTYDAAISSYRLGQVSGKEVLKLLQQSGQDIPFILVTSILGDEAAVECMKAGIANYVLKERLHNLPSDATRSPIVGIICWH